MANKNKNKKKKLILLLFRVMFICSFVVYLVSAVIVKSYGVELTREQIAIDKKISTYQAEISTMSAQISELQDYNRVVDMIDTKTMSNTTTHSIDK